MDGKKLLIIGVIFCCLIVGLHAWRIARIVFDAQAVMRYVGGAMARTVSLPGDPPQRYLPPLIDGLEIPKTLPSNFANVLPSIWDTYAGTKLAPEEQDKIFGEIKVTPEFLLQLQDCVEKAWTDVPAAPPMKELPRPLGPIPDFRRVREISRYIAVVAMLELKKADSGAAGERAAEQRTLSAEELRARALEFLWLLPLVAHHLECMDSRVTGGVLITRMIGIAVRGIAAKSLVSQGWALTPTRGAVLKSLQRLDLLEKRAVPFARFLEMEARTLPSYAEMVRADIEAGRASAKYGRNPHSVVRIFGLDGMWKDSYQQYWRGCIELASAPWSASSARSLDTGRQIEELSQRTSSPNLAWLGYLLRPEKFLLDLSLAMVFPNFRKAYEQEVLCRQRLRGAVAALALHAYVREVNAAPASVADLEKWLGRSLPEDIFSGRSLEYRAGSPPKLWSIGPDSLTGTVDDIPFLVE